MRWILEGIDNSNMDRLFIFAPIKFIILSNCSPVVALIL